MSLTKLKNRFANGAWLNNVKEYFTKINEIIDYLNGNPIPEDEYQTTIVNISSSQILNMGTTPIELIPAAGVNKYYDIEKIILEFIFNTTSYSNTVYYLYNSSNNRRRYIEYSTDPVNFVVTTDFNTSPEPTPVFGSSPSRLLLERPIQENEGVYLKSLGYDDAEPLNPTDGDGTMRAIIKYKVRTFGE